MSLRSKWTKKEIAGWLITVAVVFVLCLWWNHWHLLGGLLFGGNP